MINRAAEPTIHRIGKEESVNQDISLNMREPPPERERVDDPWEPHRRAEEQGKDTVLWLLRPVTPEERHQHGRPRKKALVFREQEVVGYGNPQGAPVGWTHPA